MREILKMVVVLALITGASGLLLAGVNQGTKEQRKKQILTYLMGPAVEDVLQGCTNNPLDDVKEVSMPSGDGETALLDIFPAYKDGKLWAVAFEEKGKGFGGDIGVIVGIDVETDNLLGIGITTMKETPGLGARIMEKGFRSGFSGIPLDKDVKVTGDGGQVDAISGATISSRGVCEAVNKAVALFKQNKQELLSAANP